ncbi:hypothetical protein CP361_04970 [Lactobacillus sp. UMNPBX10]|nr:hypothetical protein CP361_04970 [Lactobacillus sp. UMNPBX10]
MAKMIRKTILIPEDSKVAEWAKNQSQFSPAAIRALEMVVRKYGTGDLIQAILDSASLDGQLGTINSVSKLEEKTSVEENDDVDVEEKPKRKLRTRIRNKKNDNDSKTDDSSLSSKLKNRPNLDMLS